MGKNLLAALWAMLMGFLPLFPAAAPLGAQRETRCLAVGMDLFVTEEDTAPCSAGNAEIMAELMRDFLPEGTRVQTRLNGPGSAGELEQALSDAFAGAGPEDTSWLFLSTHGITWEEEAALRMGLVLSDGEREEILAPERLREMLDRIPGKKVLILDCCHAGAAREALAGADYYLIAGCGAEEECFFLSAGDTRGAGYFTQALAGALRASDREQIDADGDGAVSLPELEGRLRQIYGISGAVIQGPEGDREPLFLLPEERGGREKLQGLRFEPAEETEGQITLAFHFRTEAPVRVEYRLVPKGENGWDFGEAARLPDRERTGRVRGLMSPGEKDRSIRVSREKLAGAEALLEILILTEDGAAAEATVVIASEADGSPAKEGDLSTRSAWSR